MTSVSSATSTPTTGGSSSYQSLVGNYELFLSLLTTQIQNQDPLDPMDSSEYTNQLVQYSAVEQSIQTNDYLQQILQTQVSAQASAYVSYLGAEVTATGDTSVLSDGEASWSYKVADEATGTVEITNAAGAVVFSEEVTFPAGSGTYTWDGVTNSNVDAPEAAYTAKFSMKDSAGNSETVNTQVSGIVDGIDLSSGDAVLAIGALKIPVTAVKSVKIPS